MEIISWFPSFPPMAPHLPPQVTEYLSGGELFDAICDKEIYLEGDARKVMRCMTEAIAHCHSRGVLHRDIKPENLILASKASYSSVKLIDFGFARLVGPGREPPHDLRGTPYYLAPEVIQQIPYGKPVDIWSLGCILHVMLVGAVPFQSHDIDKLYKLIQVLLPPSFHRCFILPPSPLVRVVT
jgi:calcium/calmodulin-dependent protein kinase (CaM kinase) II